MSATGGTIDVSLTVSLLQPTPLLLVPNPCKTVWFFPRLFVAGTQDAPIMDIPLPRSRQRDILEHLSVLRIGGASIADCYCIPDCLGALLHVSLRVAEAQIGCFKQ